MTRLLAFLKGVPVTVYLVLSAIAVAGGWLALNNAHQREVGALKATMQAKQAASDSAAKVLIQRNAQLDSLVSRFTVKVAQVTAAKASTDAATTKLKSARDSLAQAVADSLATIQELRDRGARLIAASDSAEKAHAVERAKADAALMAAKQATAFAVDSVKQASLGALNAAIARAVSAERLAKVQTGLRARLVSRCGVIAGVGGVWAGGSVKAGPAVTVGCKLFP